MNPELEEGKLTQHGETNKTVFLDFFHSGTKDLWSKALKDLFD